VSSGTPTLRKQREMNEHERNTRDQFQYVISKWRESFAGFNLSMELFSFHMSCGDLDFYHFLLRNKGSIYKS
jgi:hypothetical protein